MLLVDVWKLYERDKMMERYSPNTIKSYKIQFDLLVRYLGDVAVIDITTETLKDYIINTTENLKSSSLEHRIKFLRALFRWMNEEGYIEKNIAKKLKFPKNDDNNLPKYLKDETIEIIKLNCKSIFESMLIEFLFTSGVRIGELFNLNKDDFDFSNRIVIVKGKGNKEREAYFSKRAEILIKKYFEERKDDKDCFICKRNKPYDRMSIHQIRLTIKEIAKRSNVKENVTPHSFRHSYAMRLLTRGVPLDIIQDYLGHADPSTTKVYARVPTSMKRQMYRDNF